MTALLASIFGVLGLVIGSFLNVVIHRVPRSESIVRPPSSCPNCRAEIRARDNVPVLSYLLLRGRCRACGHPIAARYPLVELMTAALWVAAVLRFVDVEPAAFVAVMGSVLLVLSAIDLDVRRLPNVIVVPSTVVAIVWVTALAAVHSEWTILARAVACGMAAFALFLLIALVSGGMGMGDVKLAGFIGVVTGRFGWEIAVGAVFASFFVGGAAAIVLLLVRRVGRKQAIPFGPAIAVGAIVALFAGPSPVRAWLNV